MNSQFPSFIFGYGSSENGEAVSGVRATQARLLRLCKAGLCLIDGSAMVSKRGSLDAGRIAIMAFFHDFGAGRLRLRSAGGKFGTGLVLAVRASSKSFARQAEALRRGSALGSEQP